MQKNKFENKFKKQGLLNNYKNKIMQQNHTINLKRYSDKSAGKPVSSFHMETNIPMMQKTQTVHKEMMDDFLNRQKEYDKIYKTNHRNYGSNINTINTEPEKYHLFKDAVKQAKLRFLQFNPDSLNLKANNLKKQNYEHLTETVRMKQSCKNRKFTNFENSRKQIEIGFIVIIAIPIIFALTLLFELLK